MQVQRTCPNGALVQFAYTEHPPLLAEQASISEKYKMIAVRNRNCKTAVTIAIFRQQMHCVDRGS